VSGSHDPAEQGQLTIFASGPRRPARASLPCSMRWASAPSGSGRLGSDPG
jgi:3-hydroxyisobutyrate dehydrogenase-like beta-hydroxyacid dehydrogenase